MIKKNLAKAVMLGLCMATLSTGSAYGMLAQTPGSSGEVSAQSEELTKKQEEIDKILFKDKAKEIEKQGFMVNYTGVVEDVVEIGISPYSEENATFLYELVGKDKINVVEMDQSIIYASGAAPDAPVADGGVDEPVVDDEMDAEVIMYNEGAEDKDTAVDDAKAENTAEEEKVYKTTSVGTGEEKAAVTSQEVEEKNGAMVPVIAIAAAGLVGGAILAANKKKSPK